MDEDVAIVPDDTLSFMVKARLDPSTRLDLNDYTTVLQVSTWGVSVQKIMSMGTRKEIQFWCYTDFYKWYANDLLIRSNHYGVSSWSSERAGLHRMFKCAGMS